MAEQDFKFDDALLMKTAREMLAKKLTDACIGDYYLRTESQRGAFYYKIYFIYYI